MLKPGDFTSFFRDVHGYEPFPWQQRLTDQVLSKESCFWPRVLDLPTGTGKTAVLDTAIFTMAIRPNACPRRIVFVIDRRIVVDQVYKRAQRIKERIESSDTPVLGMVREQLEKLSNGESLGVVALRGGIPIDNGWTLSPDKPWIMVSTVDQFGSRLLFRGYGVSPNMRPVHAGLAGNDCLVILDEVHLSLPFAETLDRVSKLKCGIIPRRFSVIEMSATPSDDNAVRFTLDKATDLEKCEELSCRVEAIKKAELISVRNHNSIPAAILKKVRSIEKTRKDKGIRSVGIIVNRVRVARETYRVLKEAGFQTFMLTGRMRPLDRLDVLDNISTEIDPDVEKHDDVLTILVATQAIEVGADFSFDALITECAPVDSLRQRFGRLDRRGRSLARTGMPAQAWIVGPKSIVESKNPDPIYAYSVKATWEKLKHLLDVNNQIDVGPLSLKNFPEEAIAPRVSAPLLLKSHMDTWVQTNPEPTIEPSLDWFLHGINIKHVPDVFILWRWDMSSEALSLVPPRNAEFLQIPVNAARSWLRDGLEVDIADVDSFTTNEDGPDQLEPDMIEGCVRWEGFTEGPKRIRVAQIRPGDILILRPDRGGLSAGTWDPSSVETITDLGDAAQLAYGKRATLRLDSRLHPSLHIPHPTDDTTADYPVRDKITQLLSDLCKTSNDRTAWIVQAANKLHKGFEIVPVGLDDRNQTSCYYILSERSSITQTPLLEPETMDGSDESGVFTGTGVLLKDHLHSVGERAMQIAQRLGCVPELAEDLNLAGQLHDIGKVDRRFQNQLVGGDPVKLEMLDQPLAKSLPDVSRIQTYPKGMRHEAASLGMVKSNSDILAKAHDPDLVLHLIGTHHGWGHPLLPIIKDPEPQKLSYTIDGHILKEVNSDFAESSLALDMADCFWRVIERYGYHGLAWLEAILRLADHQQSAQEKLL